MESKCGSKKRKESDLDHGIIENRSFCLMSRSITILELPADSTIASSDGYATSEYATCLHDDSRADPGKGTVDKGGRATTTEFVCVGIDMGVTSQHANVRHLYLVEQQETVVHSIVAKLGANVSNMDVLQRLVCLEVSDLDTKRRRTVGLSINDELGHDDGMVCSASQRTNPPFTGS